jgi:transcriptional regulator with GAF, ATPase, and Fis domain
MNPRVVGVGGPFKGTTFPLMQDEVSVGRDSSNQLWTSDPALSRRQCIFFQQAGEFRIRDLESRNGTLVNGIPVQEQPLKHCDRIDIGNSVLVFLLDIEEPSVVRNLVELTDTTELDQSAIVLNQKDAVYLQPERLASLAPSARLARDLNSLLKIATGIGGIRDRESLQWQLLGLIFDVVPAERGAILYFENEDEFSSAVAWDRLRGPGHPVRVSRTVVRRVLRERAGLLVSDLSSDRALRSVVTLSELRVHSLLCVPLFIAGNVTGAIYLDSRTPTEPFDEDHLQVMTAVAGIASLALDNAAHWERLSQENRELRAEINLEHNMVGSSKRMREVYEFIRRVAPTDSTVLIHGESGTGKELVARAIHRNSARAEQAFVAINCAALTESLLESELFGHEKGAFTGASMQKKGKLEAAAGGTLFLDEISEMVPALQAKVLRVLQEREFERVGGTRTIKADIRVIAASNRSLPESVQEGTFRGDLYYRLNVVAVTMPPLRERREDIPVLAGHFISKTARKCKTRLKAMSPGAEQCLVHYDWPGNVRELENAIERAMVLGSAETILPDDFPEAILEGSAAVPAANAKYHGALKDVKKQLILQALQQADGSYIEAAKTLGMHPNSLLRLIRNLGLKAARSQPS